MSPTLHSYEDIWRHRWIYVPPWTLEGALISPLRFQDAAAKAKEIREHLDGVLADEPEKATLRAILEEVFFVEVKNAYAKTPTTNESGGALYREAKRLTHPECFPVYFQLRAPLGVPDGTVEQMLLSWAGDGGGERVSADLATYGRQGQLREVFEKVVIFRRNVSQEIVPTVVKSIFGMSESLSRIGDFWSSEYNRGVQAVLQLIEDRAAETDVELLIHEIVKEAPIHFAILVVMVVQGSQSIELRRIRARAHRSEIRELAARRLRRYFIDEGHNVFEAFRDKDAGFVLYQWATDWGSGSLRYRDIVRSYVHRLLEEQPGHVGKLLDLFVSRSQPGDGRRFDYQEAVAVFDPMVIGEIVHGLDTEMIGTADERVAIQLFQKARTDREEEEHPTEGK